MQRKPPSSNRSGTQPGHPLHGRARDDDGPPQSGFAHQGGATGHETDEHRQPTRQERSDAGGGDRGTDSAQDRGSDGQDREAYARDRDTDRGGAYDRGNGGYSRDSGGRH